MSVVAWAKKELIFPYATETHELLPKMSAGIVWKGRNALHEWSKQGSCHCFWSRIKAEQLFWVEQLILCYDSQLISQFCVFIATVGKAINLPLKTARGSIKKSWEIILMRLASRARIATLKADPRGLKTPRFIPPTCVRPVGASGLAGRGGKFWTGGEQSDRLPISMRASPRGRPRGFRSTAAHGHDTHALGQSLCRWWPVALRHCYHRSPQISGAAYEGYSLLCQVITSPLWLGIFWALNYFCFPIICMI